MSTPGVAISEVHQLCAQRLVPAIRSHYQDALVLLSYTPRQEVTGLEPALFLTFD